MKIGASGLHQFSAMGAATTARGDVLVAGVPGNDYGAGTAVIMDRDHLGWNRTSVLAGALADPPDRALLVFRAWWWPLAGARESSCSECGNVKKARS